MTMPGAEAQITAGCVTALVILFIFCCCCFGHILDYFFLLIIYNPLWQKKQEWEWQGDSIIQMAFHMSIDCSKINDTERQGSFIYFASKIFFCKMNNN